jgi:hypothetical protein
MRRLEPGRQGRGENSNDHASGDNRSDQWPRKDNRHGSGLAAEGHVKAAQDKARNDGRQDNTDQRQHQGFCRDKPIRSGGGRHLSCAAAPTRTCGPRPTSGTCWPCRSRCTRWRCRATTQGRPDCALPADRRRQPTRKKRKRPVPAATRTAPGSAAPTTTSTGCCASTCPRAPTCQCTPPSASPASPQVSTTARARHSDS